MNNPTIKYNLENNKLEIYHNKSEVTTDSYNWEYYEDEETSYQIAKTKKGNSFLGIIIKNFMKQKGNHYKGLEAEQAFKNLLIEKNIPCLYVGQGLNYFERNSKIIYFDKTITIKRPDYLVSFPELGTILIDVKCRRKKLFFGKESVFYIHYNDIEQLYETRNYMNLPVWIAFKDSQDSSNQDFYICSIKDLKDLKDKFFKECGKNIETSNTKHLRVPNGLLNNFTQNTLINPLNNFDTNIFMNHLLSLEKGGDDIDSDYYLDEERKNFPQKQ